MYLEPNGTFRKFGLVVNRRLQAICFGFLLLVAAAEAFAGDIERITALEKEVQELKQRMMNLEASHPVSNVAQKATISSDGWKSVANWRSLKRGMNADNVRAFLGEPKTVRVSGPVTLWVYANDATVTYVDDRLDGWKEPR